MNCESIQTLLDHSDLQTISDSERRAAQSHVQSCLDCAAAVDIHRELLAMRIPSVPEDLEQNCFESIASASRRLASRRRAGPFVLGSFVIAAAAAFVLPTRFPADDDASVAEDATRNASTSIQRAADPAIAPAYATADSLAINNRDVAATSGTAALTGDGPFVVELTRLVPIDQTELSQQFGDWFHAALIDELGRVPDLVLVEAADDIEVASIPFDASSGFMFDRNTTTWRGEYDIRLAAGAGVGDDWVGKRWTAISADGKYAGGAADSNAMRSSVEARSEYATALAEEIVEELRIELFPADVSSLDAQFGRYEAIVADTSADHSQRIRALSAAEQLALRADDPGITARLVDSTLALAEQIEDALLNSSMAARVGSQASAAQMAAVRAQFADAPADILQFLSGTGDVRVIEPMSQALLYDQSEEVRRVAASILAEFSDDPVARAALEFAAEFDASAEVRETAGNYLLDDSVHLDSIFTVVRDSSRSDQERLEALAIGELWQFVDPGFSVDSDTVDVVSDLIERNDALWRREALTFLSSSRSPSFVPTYLERLRNDPSPDVRAEALNILRDYRSLPDVDIALERTAADDPVEDLRAEAARILDHADP